MSDQLKTPSADALTGNPKQSDDLEITPADDGYIVYQPERDRVHFFNPTAVLILELCDGENSTDQIVQLVQEAYGLAEAPITEVQETLEHLKAEALLL